MNATKRNSTLILLFMLFVYSVMAAMPEKVVPTKAKDKETGQKTTKKNFYFYDEATDAYIEKVIEQSQKIWRNGDPNEAIALLINEQARLDKKGRKVNLSSKPDSKLRRLREGEKSEFPLAEEGALPRLPSPLIVALMAIRLDNGQCPFEMNEYFQEIAQNFKGQKNSIIAASQALEFQASEKEKFWEFFHAVFDQTEKDQFNEYILNQYLTKKYLRKKTLEITYEELIKLHDNSLTANPQLYSQLRETVLKKGGAIHLIPLNDEPTAYISLDEISRNIQDNKAIKNSKERIIQIIVDSVNLSRSGNVEINRGGFTRLPITFESYHNIVGKLRGINVELSSLKIQAPSRRIDVATIKDTIARAAAAKDVINIQHVLKELSTDHVPINIKNYYSSLNANLSDHAEFLFWESCPQWTDFNLQNRLVKANCLRKAHQYPSAYDLYEAIVRRYKEQTNIVAMATTDSIEAHFEQALWHRDNGQYSQAEKVYNTILEEYPKVKGLSDKVQYACFENRFEEVLMGNQDYQKFIDILSEYEALFEKESKYIEKANGIKAFCSIFSKDSENARKLIQDKALASQLFTASRILPLLDADKRMLFDSFAWDNCPLWEDYNLHRQYDYAMQSFQDGKYSDSVKFIDRLYERCKKKLTQEMLLSCVRSAIRAENIKLVRLLLNECEDLGKAEEVIASDILWLLQSGKATTVTNVLGSLEAMLNEDMSLEIKMKYYRAYSLLLDDKYEESQKVFKEMKKEHPKSLYTLKMSYLSQQRARLQSAFQLTQEDHFDGLINKADKCFDEGDIETALGIYLRVFAEYADRQEESSKACYLLGYYYLLSGNFEAANDILVFLKNEYKTTAYAKEADVLIQRIKDFTAS